MAVLAALLLGSCASGSGESGELGVEEPWARATAPGASTAAFYTTITNDTAAGDRLVAAEAAACGATELHRSEMVDGVMEMGPASASDLVVSPGESLILEPGGIHVMCLGLSTPLVAGETVEVELEFDQRGVVAVPFVIER